MPMITWKRAVAAVVAALAFGTAAFGAVTTSIPLIVISAFLGGIVLALLAVAIYRRAGHLMMVADEHTAQMQRMRESIRSVAQSNIEIRSRVRDIADRNVLAVVLNAFRETIMKVEAIEQRMDLLGEQLRSASGGIGRISDQVAVAERQAEILAAGVDGVSEKMLDLAVALDEHVRSANTRWTDNRNALARLDGVPATLERLEHVPAVLEQADKGLQRVERAVNEVRQQASESAAVARQQGEELVQNAFAPLKRLEKELGNGALRFALLNDFSSLATLQRKLPARAAGPSFSGWALEPQPLVRMAETILRERPALVVECGSGASTVLLAYALEKTGGKLVALEHLEKYADATRAELRYHGLESIAEVRHAPIEPCSTNVQALDWYAERAWSDLAGIGLLLVDGPPRATGKQARYPVMPFLSDALVDNALVVLDDTNRAEEKEVLDRWRREFARAGETFPLGPNTIAFRWSAQR